MNNYTTKVKIKGGIRYLLSIALMTLLKIFWLFPLKEEKILFLSFDGKQYSDSPKYICEEVQRLYPGKEIVWAIKCRKKFLYLKDMGYKIVQRNSVLFIRIFTSSKTIVTNNHIPTYLPVRKNQILLNTWHGGSPLKTVGFAEAVPEYYDKYYYTLQNKKYKAFLSSSHFMTKEVFKRSFGYNGIILEFGMPRNAILLKSHEDVKRKIYDFYSLELNQKAAIVLYAPTFRGDFRTSRFISRECQFNVQKCIQTLNSKYNKNFTFFFRAHHAMNEAISDPDVIKVSDYPDMQELLCASDVLITDYSSCMGDMALMMKPTFLYTPDLAEYVKERGFYWDIHSLPFPISRNENELYKSILEFDQSEYEKKIDDYLIKLGSVESSSSVTKTVEWMASQW